MTIGFTAAETAPFLAAGCGAMNLGLADIRFWYRTREDGERCVLMEKRCSGGEWAILDKLHVTANTFSDLSEQIAAALNRCDREPFRVDPTGWFPYGAKGEA